MNTFGNRFRLTTFGESHGPAIGGVIDGCPAGLAVDYVLLEAEMTRRHVGAHATTRHESDNVEFLSGIYDGKTLGTPIAFIIRNSDARSSDYDALDKLLRPGHADFTTLQRYGIRDPRGGGRASGRETAVRVAAGAIAKMILNGKGIGRKRQHWRHYRMHNRRRPCRTGQPNLRQAQRTSGSSHDEHTVGHRLRDGHRI